MKNTLIETLKSEEGRIIIKGEQAESLLKIAMQQVFYESLFAELPEYQKDRKPDNEVMATLAKKGQKQLMEFFSASLQDAMVRILREKKRGHTKADSFMCLGTPEGVQIFKVELTELPDSHNVWGDRKCLDICYMERINIPEYLTEKMIALGIEQNHAENNLSRTDAGYKIDNYLFEVTPVKMFQNN